MRSGIVKFSYVCTGIFKESLTRDFRLQVFSGIRFLRAPEYPIRDCDILRPQLAMNRFLPLWHNRFPHFGYIYLGGGAWGALILDRCRAFDLFASVDAHLCRPGRVWLVTSRLGTVKSQTFLYSEDLVPIEFPFHYSE
jgi:hypothetical protein